MCLADLQGIRHRGRGLTATTMTFRGVLLLGVALAACAACAHAGTWTIQINSAVLPSLDDISATDAYGFVSFSDDVSKTSVCDIPQITNECVLLEGCVAHVPSCLLRRCFHRDSVSGVRSNTPDWSLQCFVVGDGSDSFLVELLYVSAPRLLHVHRCALAPS